MFRWLLWKFGLARLVVLMDYDGDTYVRVVWEDNKGLFILRYDVRHYLNDDGTTRTSYIKRWFPYHGAGTKAFYKSRLSIKYTRRASQSALDTLMHKHTVQSSSLASQTIDRLTLGAWD